MIANEFLPPVLRTLHRLRTAFWQRRVVYWLIRALWMALLVPTIVMGGYIFRGWEIAWNRWTILMVLVGVLLLIWSLRPINLKKMTRRLDNLLGMRAQLITAFEVSEASQEVADQPDNPVIDRLVQDSVNVTVEMRRQVNIIGQGFWLEITALIAVVAILGALFLFDALRPNIPNAPIIDLPTAGQEPQAEEVIPPDPNLQPQVAQQLPQELTESQLRNILQILADALRDQAVTHSIAEAIDRNDLAQAAEDLRRLADRLDDLSSEAHQELGNSLQEASDNIGQDAPTITEPLDRGKRALDINNLTGASQALDDLAEVLENLDDPKPETDKAETNNEPSDTPQDQPQPATEEQGSGDSKGQQGSPQPPQENPEERLPIDGQPLELEDKPKDQQTVVQAAKELDAQPGDKQASENPFTRQPLSATGDDLGPDPLTYPWEKRDVVRHYFTPQTGR